MNTEAIKVMNRNPNSYSKRIRNWWNKNNYKVYRVIFFPIWFFILAIDRIKKYRKKHTKWDENRVQKILDYYIPHRAKWDAEKETFYFFDNGLGWYYTNAKKYLKLKDRNFWKVWGNYECNNIRKYLIQKYELEGFTKEIINTFDGWTDIEFHLNKD